MIRASGLRRASAALLVVLGLSGTSLWAQSAPPPPDASFGDFLAKFASDPVFRRDRVRDPLTVRLFDKATGEVHKESWARERFRRDLPPLLSAADLKEKGLDQRIKKTSGTRNQVVQYRPEARDYLKTYTFEKVKGLWFLSQFEDASR